MSEDLFLKILEKALLDDPDFPLSLEPRWIAKLDDEDSQFMAEAEVEVLRLSSSRVAAKMTLGENSVLAISGFPAPLHIPEGLNEIDATPGTFALFALEAELPVTGTSSQIRDISEAFGAAHPPYYGHDLDMISPLFPKARFFGIDRKFGYVEYLDRIVGAYCAKSLPEGEMALSDVTCSELSKLFEAGADEIPYFILLRGMLSASHPILFLDLYRCVEQLYSVPRVAELSKALNISGPIWEIAKALEDTISWRPKEDEALARLFSEVSSAHCEAIRSCFGDSEALDDDLKSAERAARRVYKLRNASVHFRPATQGIELSEEDWDSMIRSMLLIVSEIYRNHGKAYHSAA